VAESKISALEEPLTTSPIPISNGGMVLICVPTQTPVQLIAFGGQVPTVPDGGMHA
jgi:hypothetical protein